MRTKIWQPARRWRRPVPDADAFNNVGFLIAAVLVTLGGLIGYAVWLTQRLAARKRRDTEIEAARRSPTGR